MTTHYLDRWRVLAVKGGFQVYFFDDPWPMTPKTNRLEAEQYRDRLAVRHSDENARDQIRYFGKYGVRV